MLTPPLNLMHRFEDFAALHADLHVQALTLLSQAVLQRLKRAVLAGDISDEDHAEQARDDGLGNVQNVDFVFCQICTDLCDDAYGIFTNYCYYCFHKVTPKN